MPNWLDDKLKEYILGTPLALATFVISWVSGHLWVYIVLTYVREKKKSKDPLEQHWSKIALGLVWFALVCVPVYYVLHGTLRIEYDKLLGSVVTVLLLGLAVQAVLFFILTIRKR